MKLPMMTEFFSNRSRRVLFASALGVVVVAIGLGAATRSRYAAASSNVGSASEAHTMEAPMIKVNPPIQTAKAITIDTELITLRRTGFEPAEVTRAKGPFLLSIDNKSELGEMNFRFLRENGSNERELRHKNDKFHLRQVVDLQPGRYTLSEANHPEWTCRISITAQ